MVSYKKSTVLALMLSAAIVISACTATTPAPTAAPTGTPALVAVPTATRVPAGVAVTQAAPVTAAVAATRSVSASTATATRAPAVTATPIPAATVTRAAAATSTAAAATSIPGGSAAGIEPATTGAPAPAARAPVCTPGTLTVAQTEGPYYKANPPERSSLLEAGTTGTKLIVTGYVLDQNCRPLPGAKVDFWQADGSGNYDNSGYRFRGFVSTDAQGRYSMETIPPGLYTGRTRHIHVKVTPAGGATLTTQLYLPGDAANASDGIFDPKMVLDLRQTASGQVGYFDFVVRAG